MFLGISVHLKMGCVAQRHDFIGADALKNDLLFSYRPFREEKKICDFRAPQNGRAGDGNQKKGFPYVTRFHKIQGVFSRKVTPSVCPLPLFWVLRSLRTPPKREAMKAGNQGSLFFWFPSARPSVLRGSKITVFFFWTGDN